MANACTGILRPGVGADGRIQYFGWIPGCDGGAGCWMPFVAYTEAATGRIGFRSMGSAPGRAEGTIIARAFTESATGRIGWRFGVPECMLSSSGSADQYPYVPGDPCPWCTDTPSKYVYVTILNLQLKPACQGYPMWVDIYEKCQGTHECIQVDTGGCWWVKEFNYLPWWTSVIHVTMNDGLNTVDIVTPANECKASAGALPTSCRNRTWNCTAPATPCFEEADIEVYFP